MQSVITQVNPIGLVNPPQYGTLFLEQFTIETSNGVKHVRFQLPSEYLDYINSPLSQIPQAEGGLIVGTSSGTIQSQTPYTCSTELCQISTKYDVQDSIAYFNLQLVTDMNDVQLSDTLTRLIATETLSVITQRTLRVGHLSTEGMKFSVPIYGSNAYDMATFRQFILSDVPTMAIRTVTIYDNQTPFEDAILFQIISSLVFKSDQLVDLVYYRLSMKGNEEDDIIEVTGRDLQPDGETYGVEPAEYSIPDQYEGRLVLPQSIINLQHHQYIDVLCEVTPGVQQEDARWGCVTNLTFNEIADKSGFILSGVVRGNLSAERIIHNLIDHFNQTDELRMV